MFTSFAPMRFAQSLVSLKPVFSLKRIVRRSIPFNAKSATWNPPRGELRLYVPFNGSVRYRIETDNFPFSLAVAYSTSECPFIAFNGFKVSLYDPL